VLLSRRTSTRGTASAPTAHRAHTAAGISHSGRLVVHACAWLLVPRGQLPLANRSASSPRQYGDKRRPPYRKSADDLRVGGVAPPPDPRVGAPLAVAGLCAGSGLYGLRTVGRKLPDGVERGGREYGLRGGEELGQPAGRGPDDPGRDPDEPPLCVCHGPAVVRHAYVAGSATALVGGGRSRRTSSRCGWTT
jgi:hypothetical protein